MAKRPYHLCLVDSMRSFGGAEVWVLDTARALAARGVRVSIVAQPDAQWLPRARAAGLPTAAIPIRWDAAPWTIAKLAGHFSAAGVSAIVANLTKDLKAASVAGRLAGVEVIFGSRESDFPLKNKDYYRWYFNRLATGLLVNSEATRRTILSHSRWLDPGRVHLLYKGIDTDRFAPGGPLPFPPVVGFVGQLIERKGLRDLMAAWTVIDGRPAGDDPGPPTLLLAGEGPLSRQLEVWRAGLKRPEAVQLLGFRDDIEDLYRQMTLLVMPSHAEGFGLAAAEAGACGLPVIAADASSLPEIVQDGLTGLLVPPGCPGALAAAITGLCDNPALCQDYGAAGRRHIQRNFSLRAHLDRLLALTGGAASNDPKGP